MNVTEIKRGIPHNTLFIILISTLLFNSNTLFAQVSEGGIPPSFEYQTMLRSAKSVTSVPINFYIEDLRETDAWKAREATPLRVSKLIPVDYTMDNSGYFTVLPDGTTIWRLHLKAKDAVAIMLYYNDFYIPEGGRLFIYSPDQSQLLGAYTHRTNPSGGLFATEFIGGDELILEYAVSETSKNEPRISINDIGYGYNTAALRTFCGVTTRANTAGPCEVNINCEEGAAWQNEKKSVCHTIQRVAGNGYQCTGSLVNNTAEDLQPLILTAFHCAFGETFTIQATESDLKQWVFYFNKEREGCSNSSLSSVTRSMIGCTMLANTGLTGGSDGLLLLLNDTIPDRYDVFYNGWDRSGGNALSGVGIHHPDGDFKKISTFDEPSRTATYSDSNIKCDNFAHHNVIFTATPNGHGVTEGGSSGSPLYNENKLVIGTLTGGSSSCTLLRGINLYGKLSYHWDKYNKSDLTRMDVWLDPLNKGVKTLPGCFRKAFKPSPVNLSVVNLGQSVSLTWNAPAGVDEPQNYHIYRNNIKIGDTTSLSFVDNEPVYGSIMYSVSAIYDPKEESAFTTKKIDIIKYKAPANLTAVRPGASSQQVNLSWKAPEYEQTIFWGSLITIYTVGFDERFPFYYGQKWTADDINPLHNKMIKAIQFYPTADNTYEIFITQETHNYRQPIDNKTIRTRSLNTIELREPFVIDGSLPLIVSIHVTTVGSNLPAGADDGPLVSEKGNLCSIDGVKWWHFNDDEEPGEFEDNFIIAAVVSSESGGLSTLSKNKASSNDKSITSGSSPLHVNLRQAALPLDDHPVSVRSSIPSAFPEITKHRIYRIGSVYKDVPAPATTFIDVNAPTNTLTYEVSTFYGQVESEKSETAKITIGVNNETIDSSVQIFPTKFSDFISLQGHEWVARIEVVSLSGKVCLVVAQPEPLINTSALAPGFYFIRINDIYNNQKVIKAIKY